MNTNSLSLEDSLLLSALLCGVTQESPLIHRLQLFFCANFIVGKNSAEEDYQRCIETEVNKTSENKLWNRSDRAIYELTPYGYSRARRLFPEAHPQFSPATAIENVRYKLIGSYNNENIILERQGRRVKARIGSENFSKMEDACRYLGFDTGDRSAARILYNLAVRNKFKTA